MMSVCFIQSLLGYKAPILLARAHSDNVDLLRGEGVLQKGEGVIKPGAGWTDDILPKLESAHYSHDQASEQPTQTSDGQCGGHCSGLRYTKI